MIYRITGLTSCVFFLSLLIFTGCKNVGESKNDQENPIHAIPPLVPGAKAVMITVSGSPKELITRSTVTWGFNDDQGKYRLGGRALFGSEGGTLAGEIPRDFFPAKIEVSYVVDYVDPMFTDIRSTYQCPVKTSGVNSILPVTSNLARIKIGFRTPKELAQDDYLLFQWRYDSKDTKQVELEQRGSIWLPYETLKNTRILIERELTFPLRDFNDGTVKWSLTGSINGKAIEEVEGKGQIKPNIGLFVFDLTESGKMKTIMSNPLPSESIIGSSDNLSFSPCK
jgi:hypothetical protein